MTYSVFGLARHHALLDLGKRTRRQFRQIQPSTVTEFTAGQPTLFSSQDADIEFEQISTSTGTSDNKAQCCTLSGNYNGQSKRKLKRMPQLAVFHRTAEEKGVPHSFQSRFQYREL